jgi:hypothetical protein
LEIIINDELDGKSHGEFDVDESANFKVEEEDQDHTQQEDYHSPPQDVQDLTQQKNQDYFNQEDQDNPHHNDLASLEIIIHHETLMKIILQDTLYDDPFLYVCRSSHSHDEETRLIHIKIRPHLHLDMSGLELYSRLGAVGKLCDLVNQAEDINLRRLWALSELGWEHKDNDDAHCELVIHVGEM